MRLKSVKQRIEKGIADRHLANVVGDYYVEFHIKMELVPVIAGEV